VIAGKKRQQTSDWMLLLCVPFHSRPSCLLLLPPIRPFKKKSQPNFIIIVNFHVSSSLTIAEFDEKSFIDSLARQMEEKKNVDTSFMGATQ
jgi:3,4-dihydroxy-2-butanone 4-phosphate synthase